MKFEPMYDKEKSMIARLAIREKNKETETEIPECEICGELVSTNSEDYWISKDTCERRCCTYAATIKLKSYLFDKGKIVCKDCQEDKEKNEERIEEFVKEEMEKEISLKKRKIKKQKKIIERKKEKLKELEKDLETIEKIEKEIENKIIKENKQKDIFFISDSEEEIELLMNHMEEEDQLYLRELKKHEPIDYKYIGSRILVILVN